MNIYKFIGEIRGEQVAGMGALKLFKRKKYNEVQTILYCEKCLLNIGKLIEEMERWVKSE